MCQMGLREETSKEGTFAAQVSQKSEQATGFDNMGSDRREQARQPGMDESGHGTRMLL